MPPSLPFKSPCPASLINSDNLGLVFQYVSLDCSTVMGARPVIISGLRSRSGRPAKIASANNWCRSFSLIAMVPDRVVRRSWCSFVRRPWPSRSMKPNPTNRVMSMTDPARPCLRRRSTSALMKQLPAVYPDCPGLPTVPATELNPMNQSSSWLGSEKSRSILIVPLTLGPKTAWNRQSSLS